MSLPDHLIVLRMPGPPCRVGPPGPQPGASVAGRGGAQRSRLDRLSWKPPKVSDVVDRRVVVNPRQARELLTAVTYVGQQRRGPHARGQRLMALYACMYFAALRPGEAVALRRQDCYLPATGWGRLILEKSRPEVNRRWTDTASAHDERGLKHRPASETRRVPIPPELVAILREHVDTFGVAADGRIFSSDRGHPSPPPPSATSGPRPGVLP